MDLKSLQNNFKQVMLGGRSKEFTALIHPAGTLSTLKSIEVYRRNMRGVLIKTLSEIYPICERLLGETQFRGIARGYVQQQPSRNSDLNLYGHKFSEFMQLYCDDYGDAESRLMCLPDLARLEWHYHCACHAIDDTLFDFSAFAQVKESDRNRIVFGASHSLVLMCSDYRLSLVQSLRAYPTDGVLGKQRLCVYRNGLRPMVRRLSFNTYQLLTDIMQGEKLSVLSSRFERLDQRLSVLIKKGLVTSFHCDFEKALLHA